MPGLGIYAAQEGHKVNVANVTVSINAVQPRLTEDI